MFNYYLLTFNYYFLVFSVYRYHLFCKMIMMVKNIWVDDEYTNRARKEWYVARSVYKLAQIDQKYHLFSPEVRTVLDIWCAPGSWLQYVSKKIELRAKSKELRQDTWRWHRRYQKMKEWKMSKWVNVWNMPRSTAGCSKCIERTKRNWKIEKWKQGNVMEYVSLGEGIRGELTFRSRFVVIGFDLKKVEIHLPGVYTYQQDITDRMWVQKILDQHEIQQFDVIISDMAPDTIGKADIDAIRSIGLIEKTLRLYEKYLAPWGKFAIKVFMWPGFDEFVREMKEKYWASNIVVYKPKACRKASKETYVVKRG